MFRRIISFAALIALPVTAQEAGDPPPAAPDRPQATVAPLLVPRARPEDLSTVSPKQSEFEVWLSRFRGRALAQGVDRATVDAALEGLQYDTGVIMRDRNQSEFTRTIWDYLDSAASDERVANGRAALERQARILDAIETRYGVEKEVVAAIWGLESGYGEFRGDTDVIEALATLAFDGRRGSFFEAQLVAALKIIEAGDVAPEGMTGSWAGAMGHTQFIPTSYLIHAVDFTGDGKRDIWGENPADALASTAAYLSQYGWVQGQPWGVEVTLPDGFDYTLARKSETRMPSEWAELGVVATDGTPVPDHAEASLLLPAGARGVALMTFPNFGVLERYNTADAYVIGVGHLSDRLAGGDPFQADWPREDRALTQAEREELQSRLTAAGFDTRGIDGKIGPLTLDAVRAFQRSRGMVPDGYVSLRILDLLRES